MWGLAHELEDHGEWFFDFVCCADEFDVWCVEEDVYLGVWEGGLCLRPLQDVDLMLVVFEVSFLEDLRRLGFPDHMCFPYACA